jgi:hypothetical protein
MTTETRRHLSLLRSYTVADAFRLGPAVLHPLALVYGVSGSAMISATLRVPKP